MNTNYYYYFLKNSTHFGNLEELMSKEQRGKEHETNQEASLAHALSSESVR